MDFGIAGRVAIVSGASRGIGRATAQALAAEGGQVVATARTADALEEATETMRRRTGANVLPVATDMTSESGVATAVEAATKAFGRVDIAVTNVDGPKALGFEFTDDEGFYGAWRQMVMSVAWLVRAVVPGMKEQRWGRLVNIGSDCAIEIHREVPLVLANTTRPASLGLHKSLADELGPFGITVNVVAVGGVLTENRIKFHEKFAADHGLSLEEVGNANSAHIPLRRFGRPEELGAVIAFLCSEQAGFLTGEIIACDGGRTRTLL